MVFYIYQLFFAFLPFCRFNIGCFLDIGARLFSLAAFPLFFSLYLLAQVEKSKMPNY